MSSAMRWLPGGGLSIPVPEGRARDAISLDAIRVLLRDIDGLRQQARRQFDRSQPEAHELVVSYLELVCVGFLAWIGHGPDFRAEEVGDEVCQIGHPVGFGHLVHHAYPPRHLRTRFHRQPDTSHGVADVDEGPGLAPVPWTVNG